MEPQSNPDKPAGFTLDERSKQSMRAAAATGGVVAWLIIISAVLGVVSYVVELSRPKPEIELEGFGGSFGGRGYVSEGISLIITLVISSLFAYFLYGFSKTTKSALSNNNQEELTEGLGKMASYFKTLGIIFIIVCCLSFLAFFAILAGSATA